MISPGQGHTGTDDFDLEQLVHLEQTCVPCILELVTRPEDANTLYSKKSFYTAGYDDGHAHGRLHGLIEGRTLGAEKGFELWEELGFYEGAARLWASILSTDSSNGTDACVLLPILARPSALPGRVADPLLPPHSLLLSFALADAAPTTRPHYSP